MEKEILDLISRVNCSLPYFEANFISAMRTPNADKERCTSFEQYVEVRFNYECCAIEELQYLVLLTEGNLFRCISLVDPDTSKRRFTTAVLSINEELLSTSDQNLRNELDKVCKLFGGSTIKFNSVRKKIKYFIEN